LVKVKSLLSTRTGDRSALKFSPAPRRVALQALADGGVFGKLVLEP
jgi:hypothetical protein